MRLHYALAALTATVLAACSNTPSQPLRASAAIEPIGNSGVKGEIFFTQQADARVLVKARVEGLAPNRSFGFHIHENGSCQNNGEAAGGHFNPLDTQHGQFNSAQHHAGDLPSLTSDGNGIATVTVLTPNITVAAGPQSVESRAVVVHANADDYTSQPSGNAGARIACGVLAKQ